MRFDELPDPYVDCVIQHEDKSMRGVRAAYRKLKGGE